MIKKLIIIALMCSQSIDQASAKERFTVRPEAGHMTFVSWEAGVQKTDDLELTSVVRIVSVTDDLPSKPSTFRFFFMNLTEKTVTIGPEDISLLLPDGTGVSMIAPDVIEASLRKDIKRRQALATIGGAFSAQGANGYTSGSVQFQGMTSDGTLYNGSGTYSGHDPALAEQQMQAAQAQNERVARSIEARRQEGTRSLSSLLRRTSVAPGENFGGIIAFNAPNGLKKIAGKAPIKIVVKSGEINHVIEASVDKIE